MRIGIVGAGIGGLVAAAGLEADGHRVTVYERREEPAAVGAGLTLFANAFAALDAVGLGETVRAVSSDAVGRLSSGQRRPSGRWLLSLPPSDTPSIRSLFRSDLHRALLDRLGPGVVRAEAGAEVTRDGRPVLEVDGHEERHDLVIAADGLRSRARARWGLDRGLRAAGYTAWRGVTASRGHLADEAGETWGAGVRFGIVPLPDDRVYWFATRSTRPVAAGRREADADPRTAVLEQVGTWHAPIRELVEATPADVVLRHDIEDLAALPRSFVRHRGVLLGDAAHAMTPDLGQGAGQAIEDAATLTILLRGAGLADLDAVLRRYDAIRRPRARALWRASHLAGHVAQASGPVSVPMRDLALRAVPAALFSRAVTRGSAWHPPRR
ncbi:FAD-dependent monooxygenase [Brachybacterium huguangmaarense]|uniref:FAD-dependent monooxygenase n=1 Tax=Brachybacterium huguangmaarense TaxID=1652028 RepID=A0ABY6FYF0_9MICO|nr:FAD-dependent monooxygenase [Brachybacterium huguangmaarense]UYG15887.1 FAD-dependent monooxygenase [Brachybacterium huguangmaarense]